MITEKEAREMLLNTSLIQRGDLELCVNKIIMDWKEKGFIEQSALEKANELRKQLWKKHIQFQSEEILDLYIEMSNAFRQHIKEIEENNNENNREDK